MAEGQLAPDSKEGSDEHSHIVFIDESGWSLNLLVRRTWAKKGQTPGLDARGRHRDRESVIGAVSLSPVNRRTGLYFATDPK